MSTLAQLIALVEGELKDAGNITWSDAELTAHLRAALNEYSQVCPRVLAGELSSSDGVREYSLATLTGLMEVIDVWFPYDSTDPAYPPCRPAWSCPLSGTLSLDGDAEPDGTTSEKIRVFYTAPHTIDDLDSAASTTLNAFGEHLVVIGAAARAAMQVAQSVIGTATISSWTPKHFKDWAEGRMREFREGLERERHRAALSHDPRVTIQAEV